MHSLSRLSLVALLFLFAFPSQARADGTPPGTHPLYTAVCKCIGDSGCGGGTWDNSNDTKLYFRMKEGSTALDLQKKARIQCRSRVSCRDQINRTTKEELTCKWDEAGAFSYKRIEEGVPEEEEDEASSCPVAKTIEEVADRVVTKLRLKLQTDHDAPSAVPVEHGGLCQVAQESAKELFDAVDRTQINAELGTSDDQVKAFYFHTRRIDTEGGFPTNTVVCEGEGIFQTDYKFSHYFLVISVCEDTSILFDPTFPQFEHSGCQEGDQAGRTGMVKKHLDEKGAVGAEVMRRLKEDGYIVIASKDNDGQFSPAELAAAYGYALTGKPVTVADFTAKDPECGVPAGAQ